MQTFLPYPEFHKSAQCLDYRRLGKQRVEASQILDALEVEQIFEKRGLELVHARGWVNHPATKMWSGCGLALAWYGLSMCMEWKGRGYNDSLTSKFLDFLQQHPGEVIFPSWLGDNAFHSSHRSNLLRKDPEWYGRFGWTDDPTAPYIWPGGTR